MIVRKNIIERSILLIAFSIFTVNFLNYDYVSMFHQIADDAYISLKYAYNLWYYGELNYYPGYKVEGYTNFLWTILLSLAYPFNIDPIAFAKFLGYASGIGLLYYIYKLVEKITNSLFISCIIALGMGLNLQIAYMSSWGLETIFYIFLYVAFLYYYKESKLFIASIFFTLAVMTRLEILPLGMLLLFLDIYKYKDVRRILFLISSFLLVFIPYFLTRWIYYGYPLPNTFYVKTDGNGLSIIHRGVEYLILNLEKMNLLYIIIVSLLIFLIHFLFKRKEIINNIKIKSFSVVNITIVLSAIFYSLYIIKVGGDVFNERFIIHYLPLYILSVLIIVNTYQYLRIFFSCFIFMALIFTAPSFPTSTHLTGWISLGKYINSISDKNSTLATDAAGALAYYSKIPTYDILGLNDVHIAHKQIKNFGTGVAGHEKQDNQYILDKKPTFITTWIDSDGGAGRGFKEYLDFLLNYKLIALLDTSLKEESQNRIKIINDTNINDLLTLISRENKEIGIYDWALYKRKDSSENNNLHFKLNQFNSKIYTKDEMKDKINSILIKKESNKEGYLFYGNYLKIPKGKYQIAFNINASNISDNVLGNFDIAKSGKVINELKILSKELDNNGTIIKLNFLIDEFSEDEAVEFRFYYFPNSDIEISNIELIRVSND